MPLIVLALLLSACVDGAHVEQSCGDPDPVLRAVDAAAAAWNTRDDVDVLCRADVRGLCLRDVACCVPWCGSALQRGRIVVKIGEDVAACVVHEQAHCAIPGGCDTHEASCGWDQSDVDDVTSDALSGDW